jgi:hypothetical protein
VNNFLYIYHLFKKLNKGQRIILKLVFGKQSAVNADTVLQFNYDDNIISEITQIFLSN